MAVQLQMAEEASCECVGGLVLLQVQVLMCKLQGVGSDKAVCVVPVHNHPTFLVTSCQFFFF